MLKLIIGVKGTGKTKTLISMANEAIETSKGDVVFIEKGDKLKFDVNYRCRLVDTEYYCVSDANTLYGLIAGIMASNHDVTDVFVDSALKICGNKMDEFEPILDKLNELSEKLGFNCVITSSIPVEEASEVIKKYL